MHHIRLAPTAPIHHLALLLAFILTGCQHRGDTEEWRTHTGTNAGTRYVHTGDITLDNIADLRLAWEYDTGDSLGTGSTLPTTPLMVHGLLYGVTASQQLFALDAKTGEERAGYLAGQTPAYEVPSGAFPIGRTSTAVSGGYFTLPARFCMR